MKYILIISVISAMLISACGNNKPNPVKPAIARDTLTYTYKTLKQRSPDCGTKPDSMCTAIKITYPEFKSAPVLNDTLKRRVITYFPMGKVVDTSFTALAANFIKSYQDDKRTTVLKNMFYTLDTKATVVRQDSDLITLQINGYQYTGGAHGGTAIMFMNWNTATNRSIKLDDILVNGYLPKLNVVAEKIFRKNENLSDTASLKANYFFKDGKFSVNNNFLITPLGIRFLYNQYEIKPYAAGTTDLFIPYEKIKQLLKPNTVTAQYLR